MQKQQWFETWFDTKYYHILYKNRDDREAHFFMNNLLVFLKVKRQAPILDLACGKGRHSIFLSKKGFQVTGVDLSPKSIEFAKHFETENLSFDVHDMRKVYPKKQFDYIFNLFTSFGYFEDDTENQNAITAMKEMLTANGVLVIDFLNAVKTKNNLVAKEQKTIDDITFNIERRVENNFIIKSIKFEDKGKYFSFEERVKALTINDYKVFFNNAGLKLKQIFGNFKLETFDENTSDRLIMILEK